MKILVIQQKQIGDVLVSSVLLEALADRYPEAELHYLVNSYTTPIIENHPFIQKTQLFTPEITQSKRAFFAFIKKIRKEKYDIVIDAYGKWSSVFISFFSKARIRISYYKFYTFFFYTETTQLLEAPRHNERLSIENRLALLEPLSIPFHDYKPKLYLAENEIQKSRIFLETAGINLEQPLFMVGLLGSNAKKSYPARYMAIVMDHLVKKVPKTQLLINYAPDQQEEAEQIISLCHTSTRSQIFYRAYANNLRMFIGITSYCNAFIGNEGGAANISKALSVPVFAIFSPVIRKEGWFSESEKPMNNAVHISDFMPLTKGKVKQAKKDPFSYYLKLTPEKIIPELDDFLKTII